MGGGEPRPGGAGAALGRRKQNTLKPSKRQAVIQNVTWTHFWENTRTYPNEARTVFVWSGEKREKKSRPQVAGFKDNEITVRFVRTEEKIKDRSFVHSLIMGTF